MEDSKHKRKYIWLMAAVLWMVLIFHFSNQKASESSEISGSLTYRMAEGVSRMFHFDWNEETLLKYAGAVEHPVRKAAHMTEYAVLAWILFGNCIQYPLLQKKSYLWAGIGAVLYAATDEFHQLFIEGRSGEVGDVLIDGTGAALGLLFLWIAVSIRNKRKR